MTAVPESLFLPSLDKCFNREIRVLSWKAVYEAICSNNTVNDDGAILERFFSDDRVELQLAQPFDACSSASPESARDFETRTAAINVIPSNDGAYNISEIKEDTKWLSQHATIDEITALRLVVLEWQDRPALRLLNEYSEGEALSVQQAIGDGNVLISVLGARPSTLISSTSAASQFASIKGRRERLLRYYITEKEHLLAVSVILLASHDWEKDSQLEESANGIRQNKRDLILILAATGRKLSSLHSAQELPKHLQVKPSKPKGFLERCILALQDRFKAVGEGSPQQWKDTVEEPVEFEELFLFCQFAEITHILTLILVHLDHADSISSASAVLSWFSLCADYGLFKNANEQSSLPPTFDTSIQTLVAVVSLMILVPLQTFEYLSGDASTRASNDADPQMTIYVSDPSCQTQISNLLFYAAENGAAIASLAIFAWSVILQSMRAIVTEEDIQRGINSPEISYRDSHHGENDTVMATDTKGKCLRKVLDHVTSLNYDDDPIAHLARSAVSNLQVYSVVTELSSTISELFGQSRLAKVENIVRRHLLELIRGTMPHTTYGSEVLAATLAVISGNSLDEFYEPDSDLSSVSIDGDDIQRLFMEARFRYPYEINPFLKLCKALTTIRFAENEAEIIPKTMVEKTLRFTHTLPDHFNEYELVREDENANSLRLKAPMELFLVRKLNPWAQQSAALVGLNPDDGSVITDGTIGYVLNDSKPFVVMWEHRHSVSKYLTRLLSTALTTTDYIDMSGLIDAETVSDIIDLFTKTISVISTYPGSQGHIDYADAQAWLLDASDGLYQSQDLISIVAGLFEEEIQKQQTLARGEASTAVLSSCICFLGEVLRIYPGRIWPVLARSELLDIDVRGGKLADLIAAIEIPNGRYPFLKSCLDLFSMLVQDVIGNAVSRSIPSTTMKRFENRSGVGTGIPQKMMSKMLLAFTKIFADVLQNAHEWHFAIEESRTGFSINILELFIRLIHTVYGFDDSQDAPKKLLAVLAPSAAYILECFGSTSRHEAPGQILQLFIIPNLESTRAIFPRAAKYGHRQASFALKFLASLVKVGTSLGTTFDRLERQIISAIPMLAHVYAANLHYRIDIINLLIAVAEAQRHITKDPPSMFANLSAESSKNFLSILAEFDKPFTDLDLEVKIWNFFSTVISNRQRWLATFLLTGKTPREIGNKNAQENKIQGSSPSLLDRALPALSDVSTQQPEQAIAILRFVAVAQNHWPWVSDKLRKNSNTLHSLANFLDQLRDDHNTKEPLHAVAVAKRNQTASLINEILATYLYSSRQIGDDSFLKVLIPKLGYLRARAVDVPNYNTSLHKNLESNLKRRFPGLELSAFKQTLSVNEFGPDYCYDRAFAASVLGRQQSWVTSKGQGFDNEFYRANCNLSLVESQIQLLRSWSMLVIELSSSTPLEIDLQKHLCGTAQNCLKANGASESSEQIFEDLRQTRVDLALVLLQRLTSARTRVPRMLELLSTSWTVLRTCGQDFEIAFVGNNTQYYRSLLRILFLSIQPHIYMHAHDDASSKGSNSKPTALVAPASGPILVEIVNDVIAKGFRSLATQLHEDKPETILPSDFALLTALLQTILSIPGTQNVQSQIALQLYTTNVSRNAAALFSWSDQLIAVGNDPIFGELSIQFLLALSNIPLMAEHLAVEGILSELASANLTNYYRRSHGAGPFDEPRRLHAIWTRGILPLCLNLLTTVGMPMATEVAGFLVGFHPQLSRASAALDPKTSSSSPDPTTSGITLGLAAEIQSLALLTTMLDGFRGQPGAGDIAELPGWDRTGVKEDLEGWIQGNRDNLRARIVPTNEREIEASRMPPADEQASGCENRLEERVLLELRGALRCLGGDLNSSDGT